MVSFLKFVNVEPTIFFELFASEISYFVLPNLYLRKVCHNDTSHAPDLRTPCDDEKRGVDYISTVYNNFQLPGIIWSLVFTVFASSYSDLAGKKRRVFMISALVGKMLRVTVAAAQSIFWSWSPLPGIILSIFAEYALGGWTSLNNFAYAHLFDKTSIEDRLTRVTILSVLQTMAMLMGQGCAGFLVRQYGFLISFSVCFLLYSMALICTVIFVRDEAVPEKPKINFKHVFSLKQIHEMFVLIMFPKIPKKYIVTIWLLLLVDVLVHFEFFGNMAVFYLYFRYRFHWDEEKYSVYAAYKNAFSAAGGLICTFVMSKWLKFHDALVGAFAAFWDIFATIGFYFAQEEKVLYAVPLFGIFQGLTMSTCFSLLSQFFTEQEFGRLNSMMMIFLTLGMLGTPAYSFLFKSTTETHPNVIFLLSTLLSVVICIIYCITFLSRETQTLQEQSKAPTSKAPMEETVELENKLTVSDPLSRMRSAH